MCVPSFPLCGCTRHWRFDGVHPWLLLVIELQRCRTYMESCRVVLLSFFPHPHPNSSFAPPDATISAHDLLPCVGITWGTKVVVQARNSSSLNSSMVRSQQLFSVFRSGFLFASSLRFLTRSLYLLKFSRAILLTFRAVAGKRISTYSICQPHVSVERLSSWCCSCPSLLGMQLCAVHHKLAKAMLILSYCRRPALRKQFVVQDESADHDSEGGKSTESALLFKTVSMLSFLLHPSSFHPSPPLPSSFPPFPSSIVQH